MSTGSELFRLSEQRLDRVAEGAVGIDRVGYRFRMGQVGIGMSW